MAKNFFTEKEKKEIINAIQAAEKNTSGEIRVHIENSFPDNPIARAIQVFKKLKMDKTKLQNGVLFYLSVKAHSFAVIGDKGINKAVPLDFWDEARAIMESKFKEDKFKDGLCEAIELVGQQLKNFFPIEADDENELSDGISFDD